MAGISEWNDDRPIHRIPTKPWWWNICCLLSKLQDCGVWYRRWAADSPIHCKAVSCVLCPYTGVDDVTLDTMIAPTSSKGEASLTNSVPVRWTVTCRRLAGGNKLIFLSYRRGKCKRVRSLAPKTSQVEKLGLFLCLCPQGHNIVFRLEKTLFDR